ncbi:MAG TPA: BPSS1780 family membrane protein [Albitalea sp.]|uniref:BPSS1780 family membrane protein n=1 Tax=Piscinibacter sp. TaxID=1903157 RepID=UPI002ED4D4D3
MRLKLVPARQGALWVRDGLRVFFRKPLAFCVLFLVYMLITPMLMLLVAPLATVGFMIATRQALEGRFPFATVFIEPLRGSSARRWAQIRLGVLYSVAAALVLWIAFTAGGEPFAASLQALSSGRSTPEELQPLMDDPSSQMGWLVLAVGISLLAVPFWHAPALVHWGGQGAAKSLFFSTVACWRNKGALTVFTLAWFVVLMSFQFLAMIVSGLLGVPQLAIIALAPAMLMLVSAFYASLYFSFVDSFEANPETP